jgi:hypothetical protein
MLSYRAVEFYWGVYIRYFPIFRGKREQSRRGKRWRWEWRLAAQKGWRHAPKPAERRALRSALSGLRSRALRCSHSRGRNSGGRVRGSKDFETQMKRPPAVRGVGAPPLVATVGANPALREGNPDWLFFLDARPASSFHCSSSTPLPVLSTDMKSITAKTKLDVCERPTRRQAVSVCKSG